MIINKVKKGGGDMHITTLYAVLLLFEHQEHEDPVETHGITIILRQKKRIFEAINIDNAWRFARTLGPAKNLIF